MMYNREAVIEKNITLSFEFERYVVEHPELLSQIPDGAAVIFLPKDDPELYRVNLETARKAQAEGKATSVIFLEVEALAPVRSRLINPHLTARPSLQPVAVQGRYEANPPRGW